MGGDIELIEILGRSKVKDEVSTRVLVKWKDSDKVINRCSELEPGRRVAKWRHR